MEKHENKTGNSPEHTYTLVVGILLISVACIATFELIQGGNPVMRDEVPLIVVDDPVIPYELEPHEKDYAEDYTPSTLTLSEAERIAEESCIKGGEVLGRGMYNEGTRTWWFDANLNSVHEGCNPACVVSEETLTGEINWRCTGALLPREEQRDLVPWEGSEEVVEPVEPVACTMDAKICPDGTAVGRVAPRCEFAPCPN